MDRLDSMALFLDVAECGSLSAAGRRLGIPLATVSRRIADLETHLGTRLFNRTTRSLVLTEAGQGYRAACGRILDDVDEAERAAAGEYVAPRGELILAAPLAFGRLHMTPVVADFLAAYPDIDVRMLLADRLAHLLDDHIDLALRIGDLPDSTMVATRVGEVRRVLCAAPRYLEDRGTPETIAALADHRAIAFSSLGPPGQWDFGTDRAERSVPVSARLTVNSAEAAVDACIAGAGIVRLLSYQCADAVRDGRLVLLLEDEEPAPWPIHLVRAGQERAPVKIRAFLDFATPRLRARLAQD
ncbi:LysR family transcriptional regulator [Parasphingopyxis marina]|uniref:LysR family transcriptional regulator n=1 Tax=Parasphingopyxis marina TaxID=2761622 RepID=A0A842HWT1_9SPHN|nr:LysR family transcriptional regulator [Parasphingopyxis marina]MBC2776923.1 LysR family transcriptional regulator [Parasphingopyxis marina]